MEQRQQALGSAIGLLKQLSHPVRLSILCNLMHKGEMSVSELVAAEEGAAGQSQVSQYLGKMRAIGLVACRRSGQTIFYRIASHEAQRVIETLYDLYCQDKAKDGCNPGP